MNHRIGEYNRAIAERERKMNNCSHDFIDPTSNTESIKVGYDSTQDGKIPDSQKNKSMKMCSNCGLEKYNN